VAAGGFDASEDTTPRGEASSLGRSALYVFRAWLLTCFSHRVQARECLRESAVHRQGDARHNTPVLHGVYFGPQHALQFLAVVVRDRRERRESSMARGVATRGISLPPRIVVDSRITRTSSPGRAASVDAGNTGYFGGLETGDAGDANGASGGSIYLGDAAAGSSARVEDVDME
jgi:hypothetical protein